MEQFSFIEPVGEILLFYAPSCESTQDLVPLCREQVGGRPPTALMTFHQTRGRGQHSRIWESEPGKNLALSVLLPLKKPRPELFPQLNMALSVACANSLRQYGIQAEIKWPNDLRFQGAKLAGLLMEVHTDTEARKTLCLGIGVNVNQTDFERLPQSATSLKLATGQEQDLTVLARNLLKHLNVAYHAWEQNPESTIYLTEFNHLLEGRNAHWEAEKEDGQRIHGQLDGVDPQGRVLLRTGELVEAYHHGKLRLRHFLSHE